MKLDLQRRWAVTKMFTYKFMYFVPYFCRYLKATIKEQWALADLDRKGLTLKKHLIDAAAERQSVYDKVMERAEENRAGDYTFTTNEIEVFKFNKDECIHKPLDTQKRIENEGVHFGYTVEACPEAASSLVPLPVKIPEPPREAVQARVESFQKLDRKNLFVDNGDLSTKDDTPVSTALADTEVGKVLDGVAPSVDGTH